MAREKCQVKSLVVSDGGHRFLLLVREDVELPPLPTKAKPLYALFMDWWRAECGKMNIPYEWTVAEPQGIRIVQSLLRKHTVDELQELARHFFLDHGSRLRSDPRHFSIFASMVPAMKQELNRE